MDLDKSFTESADLGATKEQKDSFDYNFFSKYSFTPFRNVHFFGCKIFLIAMKSQMDLINYLSTISHDFDPFILEYSTFIVFISDLNYPS